MNARHARGAIIAVSACAAVAALSSPARAELPPQYVVLSDFAAVAGQSEIASQLGVVDRIERTSSGEYLVTGGKCELTARVMREAPKSPDGKPIVGPSRIVRVDLGPKRCN